MRVRWLSTAAAAASLVLSSLSLSVGAPPASSVQVGEARTVAVLADPESLGEIPDGVATGPAAWGAS